MNTGMRHFSALTAPPYKDLSSFLKKYLDQFVEDVDIELDGIASVSPSRPGYGLTEDRNIPTELNMDGTIPWKRPGGFYERVLGTPGFIMNVRLSPVRDILLKYQITSYLQPFETATPSPVSWDDFFSPLMSALEQCTVDFTMYFQGINYIFRGTLRRGKTSDFGPTIGSPPSKV